MTEESKGQYGRTAFNGVLLHNDRVNTVNRLMHKYRDVDKFLSKKNGSEEEMIKRLEEQEAIANGTAKLEQTVSKKIEKPEKKWKQKLIKIWEFDEKMMKGEMDFCETSVGPNNFVPIMKLGQGSFGQVYLVDKINIMKDGSKVNSGKQYAMKILNKK